MSEKITHRRAFKGASCVSCSFSERAEASESLGNREIAHVNHGTEERSIPSGKPPQTKPEKPYTLDSKGGIRCWNLMISCC